ncbi:hypothetical protein ABZ735_06870, partial [Streptomyces longwoodensis]
AWMGDPTKSASLRAELMAAAVVSAHNHVLRRAERRPRYPGRPRLRADRSVSVRRWAARWRPE